jgi:succinate-acetate transporter protein
MFVRKVANKNYRIEGRESMHSDSKLKEIRSVILSVNCMYAYCISWTIYTHIMTSISIKELMSLRVTVEHVM